MERTSAPCNKCSNATRCEQTAILHDGASIYACGGARHYIVSPDNRNFADANVYCAGLGVGLVKWDTLEKYLDALSIAGMTLA